MIESLLSLPSLIGALVFMAFTAVAGLAVYLITFKLHARRHSEEAIQEIRDATGNLFRVVGWLFTLLLSLTFTDVVAERSLTESAVENEAVSIEDLNHNLRRFDGDEAKRIQALLIEYTATVISQDWPALAENRLSAEANGQLRQLADDVVALRPEGTTQENLQSRLLTDLDRISDYRQSRLLQAREKPSEVLMVVFLGYLVTMVYFGIYQPRPALVALLSLYALFVGVAIYLILAMGDPFQGALSVSSRPLEFTLDYMRSVQR